jgi:hypothetical protein
MYAGDGATPSLSPGHTVRCQHRLSVMHVPHPCPTVPVPPRQSVASRGNVRRN